MNKIILCIVLASMSWGQCVLGMTNTLVFSIETDKKEYLFGEPIILTCRLTNRNQSQAVAIDASALMSPLQFLEIKDPSGSLLVSTAELPRVPLAEGRESFDLNPGQTYSNVFNLSSFYGESYPINNPHNFDTPGKYVLKAVYKPKKGLTKLNAVSVVIDVKSLSVQRSKELLSDIQDVDSETRITSLGLLRRARVRQCVPVALDLLEQAEDIALRRESARVVYDLADMSSRREIVRLLKASDQDVRSYMALTLGRLKDRDSVDALIELCDSEKYPTSYRAAVRALIDIGDAKAIPVLKHIATRESSPEFRGVVKRAITKHGNPNNKPSQ